VRWQVVVVIAGAATLFVPTSAARADTACGLTEAGAMTWPAGASAPLRCDGGQWAPVTDPYPASDRWVSQGPVMTLRGGARQNPAIEPGAWTATALTSDTRCRAEQVSVTYGKVDGPPRVDESAPGESLNLEVIPRLLTIDLSGDCLWQKITD
jgi:hypothetical protein